MQPSLLEEFSVFTSYRILESEEECISFLQNHEIIPKKEDEPPLCPACSSRMGTYNNEKLLIGWRWYCKRWICNTTVNALKHTFFEHLRAPFRDVMAVIFGLILNTDKTYVSVQIMNWRTLPMERNVSIEKINHLYKASVDVADSVLRENGVKVTGTEDAIFGYYRQAKLNSLQTFDDKLNQFLMDIKSVYPGFSKISLNRQ